MEEPLEQEHSMTNDDLKPSSSTTKSSRSTKPTTHRQKRRRQTNSTRSSSDHSTSSSRSSSPSSNHSSHSSIKNFNSIDQEPKKSRSCLAQEQLQIIVEKTKTGKFDILDSFAFLSFETDDDWRIAMEHFNQQKPYTPKKSYSLSGKKNGTITDHLDAHSLHRSISVPCKIEDGHRIQYMPSSAPVDDTSIENHRSSMWQNLSPNKNASDRQSMTTIKSEPIDRTNRSSRTTSEHDEHPFDIEHNQNSILSSQKSHDDLKIESNEKKHHHHHHHHHHKSHKRHKTKHDLSVNGDSSNKHPTITSMSDLAKQHIKHESVPFPPPFHFPPHFDPKLFSLPSYPPFAPPPHPSSFPGSYDHQLMLASRLYAGQYPRDILMPPPPRPASRSLQHPFSLKENHPDSSTSMEKMLEKYYPGVLPSYLAAASAAAAASTNSNSPVSSLNVKMHGASPNGPDHSLWSHREALQRQFLAASNKQTSTKSPLFDSNTKIPSNHSGPSPTDHHHHHRRHSSSTSNPDIPNSTTPTGHPLYLAPVIVTEFHQHQHNHNHTHEHKLNITTKDDRQSSPRSKTPLSNETKKPKSGFSVTDMFIDKTPPIIKHSPSQQGFLSVINNKKDPNNSSPSVIQFKKPANGKWSTAHVHIAWMIYHHEQRQREKANKIRSSTTFLPPPLPLIDNNHDLALFRPPIPPPPFPFPFDMNSQQNHLFRPTSTAKLPRPMVASASSTIKTPTIKREQKTPFIDERIRRTSPSPLSRPTSGSNFLPSSPSHRMRMDYSSLLLPPPPQHQLPTFALQDDRKRFMTSNADLLSPFGPSPTPSPFLSSFFPMGAPPIPPPPLPSSSSSRRSGMNSDSSKSSLFPPSPSTPFDFTRSPLLPPGISLPNNHLESDRYRFLFEQQARERDLQFAMMAAASGGNPPPPLFTDPNSSALFKHF